MRKTRTENGITLMALIITIVVLLVLATVAISSIKNDGIISKTQDVANKFNQAQTNEQGILDQYLSYLQGEQWVTIYEGDTETVNGELLLANKHLFKAGKTYKITVKSKEFSGEVTTVAVLAYTSSSLEYYVLFGVNGGNAITASSMEEYEKLQDTIGENATVVIGANVSDDTNGNISGIMLDGSTCEYKITKIEEKVEKVTGENPEELDLLQKYVLGTSKTGRTMTEIMNVDESTMQVTYFKDDTTTIADASTTITLLGSSYGQSNTQNITYVKYNNIIYKIVSNLTTSMTQSVEGIYSLQDKVLNPYGFYYNTFYSGYFYTYESSIYLKKDKSGYLNGQDIYWNITDEGMIEITAQGVILTFEFIDGLVFANTYLAYECDVDYKIQAVKAENGIYTGVPYNATNLSGDTLIEYLIFNDNGTLTVSTKPVSGTASNRTEYYDINDIEISNDGKTVKYEDITYELAEELYKFK